MAINTDAVQRLYIAYFNRPADPAGLTYFESLLPATTVATQAQLEVIADTEFSPSPEYIDLYSGQTNTQIINNLYLNLFGRAAEPAALVGADSWVQALDTGTETFASIALQLTYSAQGTDATAIANKVTAATDFTDAVDTTAEIVGYSGNAAAASARAWLDTVTDDASLAAATTTAAINTAVSNAVAAGSGSSGTTYTLTVNADDFTGTSADDTFDGSGFFNAGTGTYIQTLNNADSIDGAAGTDTLNVILNTATATTLPAAMTSIEVINLTNTVGTNILDLSNATDVTTLNSVASATQIAQFNNVQSAPTNFGLTNTGVGLTANILNTALAGTSDAATLTLQGVTAGTVTLQTVTAASGYETLNVVSNGTATNVLTGLTDGVGTSLATINVSGAGAVTLGAALDNSVTTLNASTLTGALTATTGTSVIAVTGGTDDDTIIMAGTYTTADTINGGAGTDILSLTSAMVAGVTVSQANVSNIETITLSDASTAATYTVSAWNGATNLVLSTASTAAITVNYAAGAAGISYGAVIGTGAQTLNSAGSATTDSLALTIGTTAAGVLVTSATVTSGFETIDVLAQGGTGSLGAITMAATAASETINVTGAVALTLGAVTADALNASTLTGALSMVTGTVAAGGITITGGTAGDALFGGTAADIISGGAGADTITGFGGADILTGDAGLDIFYFAQDVASAATYVTDANITDFAVGTTTGTSDVLNYSIANTFGAGAASGLTTGAGVAGAATAVAAGTTVVQSVGLNAAAAAASSNVNIIKLTTGVAAAATNQLTFDAAIGTGSVTGLTTAADYAAMFYDTTNSKAVFVTVLTGVGTVLAAADVIRVIGTADMSASDYALFDTDNLAFVA
jgi:hypothetical protein